jgi:hypothetical protein
MDPDQTLAELRDGVTAILATDDERYLADLAGYMALRIQALDTWLTHGGDHPAGWRP